MPDSDDSREERLAIAFGTSVVKLVRRLRAERQDDSLGLAPLLALVTIIHQGPISPSALADREGVQPSSLTRIIATLERRGLIAREPHPDDKRQVLVRSTDAGQSKWADEITRRHAWLVTAMKELSPDEITRLEAAVPILTSLANR